MLMVKNMKGIICDIVGNMKYYPIKWRREM